MRAESEAVTVAGTIPEAAGTVPAATHHRVFAAMYERMARAGGERTFMEPLRRDSAGRARGVVLEVGAGTGLNFAWYDPARVERVAAIEPDVAMRRYAERRRGTARVPITLTAAPVEALPFADTSFDSVVATLVFCSVGDPAAGLREIVRVLKPGGSLYLVEHVRARGALAARIQDWMVPLTTRFAGNCHWNRDTASTVRAVGLGVVRLRETGGGMHPIIVVEAVRGISSTP
ncbi:MAG TPA: class I SAM-dependent methyltransferase [Ktedonobacterales bacterium]|jgi:ubiquinone/menaquinone biosynthesis C-methylase UbiE|nr:class I SAM-dependent methyltransferase [Ktedonobacterales bacterium]